MKKKWTKPEGWQPALKGKGRGLLWIKEHLDYDGDDCIPWPIHQMTPAEIEAQRQSWVRGMTARCEHGALDFEQCPHCRAHKR